MTGSADAPKVKLGGKDFAIPVMTIRQNRVVDPLILSLLPVFAVWQTDKAAALTSLGSREYDALIEIAYQGVRSGQPEFDREKFLDLPVTLPELIAAFPVIAQQTGVFERGEAVAGTAPQSAQTGTESSLSSAT